MNVVDSSGWLEYFAGDPNADFFAAGIENVPELVVPTISIYEVFKRVLGQRGEGPALQAVAVMRQGLVTDLDAALALRAAKISANLGLPMADNVIWRPPARMTPSCGRRTRTSGPPKASDTSRRGELS